MLKSAAAIAGSVNAPAASFHALHSASEERMTAMLKKFAANQDGATAIEYGLIAALISVVIIGALGLVGNNLQTDFNSVATSLR